MSADENDKLETTIETEGISPGKTGVHNAGLLAGLSAKDVGRKAAERFLPGLDQARLDEALPLTGRPKTAIGRHDIRGSFGPYDIKAVPTSQLRPNPRNPRRHSKRQINRLADAIKRFGFLGIIIIDQNGMILAGHGRWEAAKFLGLETLPCVVADHLDDAAKRAFILSDNRLAELSDWDPDLLKLELAELEAIDTDFDVELTGFDTIDLDRILGPEPDPRVKSPDREGFSTDADDQLPDLKDDLPAVSCTGDLWLLGKHRLLNGDALHPQSYGTLLRGDVVRQVVSDPPYNVRIGKNVSNAKGFREFVQASGEMSSSDFEGFLEIFLKLSAKHCHDGAILHVCMDWRHQAELLKAADRAGLEFKNLCIWVKPSAGMGSFYRSQHELVLVFKTGKGPHINNFGLGQHGRLRSNTWFYPAVRGKRQGVSSPDGGHPTPKPTSMIIDAIRDCSRRREIILDPFGGSGTTLIAAERCHRQARLIELDSYYSDLTIRRFEAVTGLVAKLASNGRSFSDVAVDRATQDITNLT